MTVAPAPIVVLISGRGSNLQAIIDAIRAGALPVSIARVISNTPQASGLALAHAAGIPVDVIDHRAFATREAFEQALIAAIDGADPRLVVLAGFMRILGRDFIGHYQGRLLNIHPSLLPALPGLNTHARALAAGAREHGASVHFVTEQVDGGPVILQARVPVVGDDTAESLAARVLEQEHRIYPEAIRWVLEGRVHLQDGRAVFGPAREARA